MFLFSRLRPISSPVPNFVQVSVVSSEEHLHRYRLQQAGQMPYRFEWNSRKAATNIRKHGVSFDEASTVFDDPLAVIFDDEAHSTTEVRELILGHSVTDRLLLVCFAELPGEIIRLISARMATKKEREDYEEYRSL